VKFGKAFVLHIRRINSFLRYVYPAPTGPVSAFVENMWKIWTGFEIAKRAVF
jgi:hypothetical protein